MDGKADGIKQSAIKKEKGSLDNAWYNVYSLKAVILLKVVFIYFIQFISVSFFPALQRPLIRGIYCSLNISIIVISSICSLLCT